MSYNLEHFLKIYNCLVEICHAIDLQDITLLQALLSQENYINSLVRPRNKYDEFFYENFNSYTHLFVDTVSPFEIPLQRAINTQNVEIVNLILDASKHLPHWVTCLAAGLETAINLSNTEITVLLLSKGADPSRAFSEDAPLINAVLNQNINCAIDLTKLLLSKGAFVDPKSCGSGRTPLILASYYGRLEIVKMLVNAGADVNYIAEGEGALFCAASRGHLEVYEYLLPLVSNQEEIEFAKEEIYCLQHNIVREEVWLENDV
jgi:ankyrin repeat protein